MTSRESVRITLVSQLPPPVHGVTIITRTLIRTLETQGVDVQFVDRRFSRSVAEVGVFQVRKIGALFSFWFRLTLNLLIRRPDAIVLFGTNREFSLLSDVGVALLSRVLRITLVNYVHSVGYRRLSARRGFAQLVAFVLRTPALTVCLGDKLASDITPWIHSDSIRVIPNATAHAAIVTPLKAQFLFLSNLIQEKGVDDFVEAAIRLCRLDPDVGFVVAGSVVDPDEQAERANQVLLAGFQDRIRFVGSVGGADKSLLMAESTALIFPSQYALEAQPLTIIEAMSLGLPVVAYDIGGVGDLVRERESGFLLAPGDVDGLVERAKLILDDGALRAKLERGSRALFEERHSLARFDSLWNDVIREATTEGNHR